MKISLLILEAKPLSREHTGQACGVPLHAQSFLLEKRAMAELRGMREWCLLNARVDSTSVKTHRPQLVLCVALKCQ